MVYVNAGVMEEFFLAPQPLLRQPAQRLGAARQVGLRTAPVVELLQQFRLEARADHLARLLRPFFSCIRVNTR
jgi:hypothetical protein